MFEEAGWVNKIITAGIIAMIGWTLMTVQDLSVEIAVIQSKFETLENTISISQQDRYTRSEAISDRALLEQRITRLETWTERLSDRVQELESTNRVNAR